MRLNVFQINHLFRCNCLPLYSELSNEPQHNYPHSSTNIFQLISNFTFSLTSWQEAEETIRQDLGEMKLQFVFSPCVAYAWASIHSPVRPLSCLFLRQIIGKGQRCGKPWPPIGYHEVGCLSSMLFLDRHPLFFDVIAAQTYDLKLHMARPHAIYYDFRYKVNV